MIILTSSLTKGFQNRNLTYGALLCNNYYFYTFLFFIKKLLTFHSWSLYDIINILEKVAIYVKKVILLVNLKKRMKKLKKCHKKKEIIKLCRILYLEAFLEVICYG